MTNKNTSTCLLSDACIFIMMMGICESIFSYSSIRVGKCMKAKLLGNLFYLHFLQHSQYLIQFINLDGVQTFL